METLTPIEWQILRLTAGEPENLEQIHDQLRNSPWQAPLADAADAVRSLVEKGIIAPRAEEADEVSRIWKATFEPTIEGREALAESRPSPPPGWPEGRIYPGMFAGMMPDIPFEVFKKNRREMCAEPAAENGINEESPRRSLYGVFKDRNIRLTREDLDEARREMWGGFYAESLSEVEVYVLCEVRSKDMGTAFLDTFLPHRNSVAAEFPFPEFRDPPQKVYHSAEEIMDRLELEPNQGYSLYWNLDERRPPRQAMLFFTCDGAMIAGLVVPGDEGCNALVEIAKCVRGHYGFLTTENPPPATSVEFMELCRNSTLSALVDGRLREGSVV